MPANNRFQIKRTSVADRVANTDNIAGWATGEAAINLTDGRMWFYDGTNEREVGANVSVSRVSTSLYIGNSTVNVVANSSSIKISNSTANATFTRSGID